MKSFVASVIIFVLVIACVFVIEIYTQKICVDMADALCAFPSIADGTPTKGMIKLQTEFESKIKYLSFVLPDGEIENLVYDFCDIFSYYYKLDTPLYTAALNRTIYRIQNLSGTNIPKMTKRLK